ncbi:MAG: type II secretion system protein N, partial [Luminiphilus sp.]|nr:type II secretion system protein N [Luminiphilus sp.]
MTPRILLPLALLLFVVANAPAWLVARFLPEAVQLSALSGSIWQGSAARGTLWINGRALSLGSLSWQIAPLSLLTLQPKIAITSGWGGQKMRSTIVFDGMESIVVTDLQAQIEIGFIRQLLPLYVGGQVSLDFAELHLQGGVPQS